MLWVFTSLPQAKQEELGTALPALREAAEAQVASFREQLRGIEGRLDELGHRLQVGAANCGAVFLRGNRHDLAGWGQASSAGWMSWGTACRWA